MAMICLRDKCMLLLLTGMTNYIFCLCFLFWKLSVIQSTEQPKNVLKMNSTIAERKLCQHCHKLFESHQTAIPHGNADQHELVIERPLEFEFWEDSKTNICNHMDVYYNKFAVLTDVIFDKRKAKGNPGGEKLGDVLDQPEEKERYEYFPGLFRYNCQMRPRYAPFKDLRTKGKWMRNTMPLEKDSRTSTSQFYKITKSTKLTIALTRYEYANTYWTLVDLYNVFIAMHFFNSTCDNTQVLILDGHPKGKLDSLWSDVFSRSLRIGDLENRTMFTKLVWGLEINQSPLLRRAMVREPLGALFRETVLRRHGIFNDHTPLCKPTSKTLNGRLNLVFIWRHNYIAHPRNPQGDVKRKIRNEKEILTYIRKVFRTFNVTGVLLETLRVKEQLDLISRTDILIGMHGAGLAYTHFLPPGSGMVELYPAGHTRSWHFENLANWNKIHYLAWTNNVLGYEDEVNSTTYIEKGAMKSLISKMYERICGRMWLPGY